MKSKLGVFITLRVLLQIFFPKRLKGTPWLAQLLFEVRKTCRQQFVTLLFRLWLFREKIA